MLPSSTNHLKLPARCPTNLHGAFEGNRIIITEIMLFESVGPYWIEMPSTEGLAGTEKGFQRPYSIKFWLVIGCHFRHELHLWYLNSFERPFFYFFEISNFCYEI